MKNWMPLLDRPIAFHRIFVTWAGSINAALMLSQLVYWTSRTKNKKGWIFKSIEQWEEETGLSRREQETARKHLKQSGLVLEKKAGMPLRLFFKIRKKKLIELGMASWDESAQLVGMNRPSTVGGIRPANTETTTETTYKMGARSFLPEDKIEGDIAQLRKDFADFTIKNRLNLGLTGSTRKGWTPKILSHWESALRDFLDQLQDTNRFRRVLNWYFENWKTEYVPRCRTLPVFCKRFLDVEDSIKRNSRRNGHSDNESRNPRGFYRNGVFQPSEE